MWMNITYISKNITIFFLYFRNFVTNVNDGIQTLIVKSYYVLPYNMYNKMYICHILHIFIGYILHQKCKYVSVYIYIYILIRYNLV